MIKKALKKVATVFGYKQMSKGEEELMYWTNQKKTNSQLSNAHYVHFYTTFWGLNFEFFNGKKILDIGCGPMGSLEWADMTTERVGLDPLADSYKALGTDNHKMKYVASGSEKIPFVDGHFDVVCSYNSLNHVDDLDKTITEIKRVVKPGGLFLLITEVDHDPTPAEPIFFSFDIVEKFKPEFAILDEHHYEMYDGVYQSLYKNTAYDHRNKKKRDGILAVKFGKQ
jgi:ubiquinone/menaquinone biosynthesis C-methylase UbiE